MKPLVIAVVGWALAACGDHAPPARADAAVAIDAVPVDAPPVTTYADITLATNWTDSPSVGGVSSGGAFDGRYVYFAPSADGVVKRYDTAASFGDPAGWMTFDAGTLPAPAGSFRGVVFDGHYVYFIPNAASGATKGILARYDTHAAFSGSASWSTFDVSMLAPLAYGFYGATFDGHYLYLSPGGYGLAARYDTRAPLVPASWSWFDVTTVAAGVSYTGAIYDGRYVYFVGESGTVLRCDPQLTFAAAAAWTVFDTTPVAGGATTYFGGGFDGRAAYFIGAEKVVRYDTHVAFATATSWSAFDTTTLADPHFPGGPALGYAGFDGRYLYVGSFASAVGRYDTTAPFTATTSWSTFAVQSPFVQPTGFVFDGEYLYPVASSNPVTARFDAKHPPSLPALPAFDGSFY